MNVAKSTSENNHTSSSAKIQLIALRRIDQGTVRTIADFGLGPSLTLKAFQVIPQPGQRARVSPPSREWQGTDGTRHFAPLVESSGSPKKRVEQPMLGARERSGRGHAHG